MIRVTILLVRLVALALLLLAVPAWAQAAPPTVDDWNTKALASAVVVLLVMVGGLSRALWFSVEARIVDLKAHAQELTSAKTEGTMLAHKLAGAATDLKEIAALLTEEDR